MNLEDAILLAENGQRFRRAASQNWFSLGAGGLWFVQPVGEVIRVVRAADFTAANFFATDYTTDPIAAADVCSLPGAERPPFDAPAVSVKASFASDVLVIKGTIGAGSYGAYRLFFEVNGVTVAYALAQESGDYRKVISYPWQSRIAVTFWAESVLPLLPWKGQASVTLNPPATVCFTVPTSDYVIEITADEFVKYVSGGTWSYSAQQVESEIWTGGNVLGGATGSGSIVSAGCGVVVPAEYSGTLSNSGGSPAPYASSLPVTLSFGVSGGHYYLGVSMVIPSFATTTPGTASPHGSATLLVDGYAIPVRSIWGPSYAGNPGYVTTTTSEVILSFSR